MAEALSVREAVQRSENTRENSFLNYESPSLTAELEAGCTDKQIMRIADAQGRKHSDYFDRQALNEPSK